MHIPSFIKIGLGIQKLLGEYTYWHTDSEVISQAYDHFFKIMKLKIAQFVASITF
jgi:hypothetical protein